MGLVRLAEQRVLHREVAVKTLKEHHELSVRKLLQEAWITGSLEHPNVVPIHDLGIDEEGVPFLVMKKIEGEAWAELIEAPESVCVSDSARTTCSSGTCGCCCRFAARSPTRMRVASCTATSSPRT
ncbi:MAG: hypothetical protein H6721_18445 [Sandaracinus sp.]|nr:hypothetical protein [Sandaracinus sp.]